jgi:hypothetical protein
MRWSKDVRLRRWFYTCAIILASVSEVETSSSWTPIFFGSARLESRWWTGEIMVGGAALSYSERLVLQLMYKPCRPDRELSEFIALNRICPRSATL